MAWIYDYDLGDWVDDGLPDSSLSSESLNLINQFPNLRAGSGGSITPIGSPTNVANLDMNGNLTAGTTSGTGSNPGLTGSTGGNPYAINWGNIGNLAGLAGSTALGIYTASANRDLLNKALADQKALVANLKYAPIDIEALKREAEATAVSNATKSLALERSLTPDLANTRQELQKQIGDELSLKGNLPPDLANRIATQARTIGGASGSPGNTAPLTAALLGTSALDLMSKRQAAAGNLLAQNPLPVAGLDPGQVAGIQVGNNNAQNQFDLAKAGINSNLINTGAQVGGAGVGANTTMFSSLLNLIGKLNGSGTSVNTTVNAGTAPTSPAILPLSPYATLGR